jgi:hypothetical protein
MTVADLPATASHRLSRRTGVALSESGIVDAQGGGAFFPCARPGIGAKILGPTSQ